MDMAGDHAACHGTKLVLCMTLHARAFTMHLLLDDFFPANSLSTVSSVHLTLCMQQVECNTSQPCEVGTGLLEQGYRGLGSSPSSFVEVRAGASMFLQRSNKREPDVLATTATCRIT